MPFNKIPDPILRPISERPRAISAVTRTVGTEIAFFLGAVCIRALGQERVARDRVRNDRRYEFDTCTRISLKLQMSSTD